MMSKKVKIKNEDSWIPVNVEFVAAKGVPLLMHNPQAVDHENQFYKDMRVLQDIKAKDRSDAQREQLSELEFYSSLYMDGDDYIIPGENIEAMFSVTSHGVTRISKAKAAGGMFATGNFKFTEFDGPKSPEKRYADRNCKDRRQVIIGSARVMKVRPIFTNWKMRGTVMFMSSLFTKDKVIRVLEKAGQTAALGTYRPKFGRFTVNVIN